MKRKMLIFIFMGFVNRHLCSTPQLLEGASQGLLHLPVVRLHQELSLKRQSRSLHTGRATRLQCKGSLLPGLPSKKTSCSPEEGVGLASDSPPKLRSFPVRLISAVPPWLSKHEEKSSINKYSIVTNNSNNNNNNNNLPKIDDLPGPALHSLGHPGRLAAARPSKNPDHRRKRHRLRKTL